MTIRTRIARGLFLAAFLALAGFGIAIAQDASTAGTSPESDNSGNSGVDVGVFRQPQISPAEQTDEARRILIEGDRIRFRINRLMETARGKRDLIRLSCLEDKLAQINGNFATAEARQNALNAAIDSGDVGRRNHEFVVLTVLSSKFRTTETEANACLGQDVYELGETTVDQSIDPSTPSEDPSVAPIPPNVDVPFVPPPASPTM